MFRKELMIMGGCGLAVFLGVTGLASLAVRALQADAELVARDTLPGLINAGDAIDRLNNNWIRTSQLVRLQERAAREALIRSIETNSSAPLWEKYGRAIYGADDARLFQEMEQARNQFFALRSNYFALTRNGDQDAAGALLEQSLNPAFTEYQRRASAIYKLNAQIGQARAERILKRAWWTPYALGSLCTVILLAGVFIGFKASLGAFAPAQVDDAVVPPN
jgi:hypothetical protein